MTDTLKSDIHFGDCYHDIKNPATEKNIFPWHTRSTIDITHNNISFSAIKNDLTAISNEDRTCINAILLICEKHLANHPLKCVSDIVQFNKNHASLKIADRLDESLSTLQKDFSWLDECVRSLQAGSINLPNVKENISHFYKTYNDFEKFRDVVKNLSDASVIELMKIQKI